TVTVIVEPAFFALTSTPSIGPSSADVTRPWRAEDAGASAAIGATRAGTCSSTAPDSTAISHDTADRIQTSGSRSTPRMVNRLRRLCKPAIQNSGSERRMAKALRLALRDDTRDESDTH